MVKGKNFAVGSAEMC